MKPIVTRLVSQPVYPATASLGSTAQVFPLSQPALKSAAAIGLVTLMLVSTGCQSMRAQSSHQVPTQSLPSSSASNSNSNNVSVNNTSNQTANNTSSNSSNTNNNPINADQVGGVDTNEAHNSQLKPAKLDSFMINGKIGITVPATETRAAQGGSAFYAWGQQNDRFAIEIIGALGLGKTNIEFNGNTATLVSEKTGTLSASNPDELFKKVTGWQVPISQLSYWISGHPAPSDSSQQLDANGRLAAAVNGDWSASFDYQGNETLPSKLTARHAQGQKVVLTINHQNTK